MFVNRERLKYVRILRGLKQYELAARAGLTHKVVSDAECGRSIGPESIDKIAEALQIAPEYLKEAGKIR